jgi:hydroxymethylbilane synthase
MKDLPAVLPAGLEIAAVLPRDDPRDAFLSSRAESLDALPAGARIGTSSVRRRAQVARLRPDLEPVLLRGNVDTRLAKLDAGNIDAALLAYAGLKRLGLEHRATMVLPVERWLPALSQGAIGIEVREGEAAVESVAALNHSPTAVALACERAFQQALDGSCTTPIGGLAEFADGCLRFRGEVLAQNGSGFADTALERVLGSAPLAEAAALGREAGLALKPRAAQWLSG